jgi:hypothetical protein
MLAKILIRILPVAVAGLLLAALSRGGEPAAPAAPGNAETILIFQLRPKAEDPASVKSALTALDEEVGRLIEANEKRKGGVKAANQERIEEIQAARRELAQTFSLAKWQSTLRDVFNAMEVDRIAKAKFDDTSLWNLSQNAAFVKAGKSTVMFNCVPCHLPSLRGKSESPQAFAPDLTDTWWIHGGHPHEVLEFITHGKPQIGMPGWGDLIGAKKVTEVAAYVLSKHKEGEPIQQQASNVPVVTE